MIIWGGWNGLSKSFLNSAANIIPSTDSWTDTSTSNPPLGDTGIPQCGTGDEMIVWGGGYNGYFATGGQYNPGGYLDSD